MATLGEKIKLARQAKKYTQAELASLIGATNTAISNWENNINKPDLDTVELLCAALGVSAGYFIEQPGGLSDTDAELQAYLEELRTRPEMKMLFSLTKKATKKDVEDTVRIIEALLNGRGQE